MSRALRADRVLRYLMSGRDPALRTSTGDGAFGRGLAALQAISDGDFAAASESATAAVARSRDPDARSLARAVAGLTIAHTIDALGDGRFADPVTGGDALSGAVDDLDQLDPELRAPLVFLLAEAALAGARVDLAADLLASCPLPDDLFGRADHPYLTLMRSLTARVFAFRAEISSATAAIESALAGATSFTEVVLARGTAALVLGNANDRAQTRQVVELVESGEVAPVDMVTRGCYVLAAYGAVALGEHARAARLILLGGGGPGLDGLRIIDRALGLELLASAAAEAHDADAAEAWLTRAGPLSEHPIAAATVSRIRARLSLLGEDPVAAIGWATEARQQAEADGRTLEAAYASILLARAQIESHGGGGAARELAAAAALARGSGHLAFVRAASRELRSTGRRLPPESRSGWSGLSPRERDVAQLVAEGFTNSRIAGILYLSEHTVRMHVSRVLHAFGTSNRAGVALALAPGFSAPAAALTARQREIVKLILDGAGNRGIAASLGIGVSTVEKHVGAIMRRWGVSSRAGIIRAAGGRPEAERSGA